MKKVLKKLLAILAIPVSLVVVFCLFLQGCRKDVVCDPVHQGKPATTSGPDPNPPPAGAATKPTTQPIMFLGDPVHVPPPTTKPVTTRPMICDPVHIPPPTTKPVTTRPMICDPVHMPPPPSPKE